MRKRVGITRDRTFLGVTWRAAVLLNDWALPIGWRYDFPMDCWHVAVLCFHVRAWPAGR